MTEKNKTIAIIIPAWNCAEYVMDCIRSIRNQKAAPGWKVEWFIGTDACEKTTAVLEKNRVQHYRSSKNVGHYVMRNSMMALHPADAYAYFDADDVMRENYILRVTQELESHPIVLTGKINCNSELVPKSGAVVENGGAMAFTHAVLEAVGGYKAYQCAADTDFLRRVEMAGFQIHEIKEPLYFRRAHANALTKRADTGMGSPYRKKIWQEMTAARARGEMKIEPVTTPLTHHAPAPVNPTQYPPVYLLIRTSERPSKFRVMMQSVRNQTYPNIITIVHSDNEKDEYVEGDIIIRGEKLTVENGRGFYNLYCNALLDAIPDGPGWYFFLDDDDIFCDDNVIQKLVAHSKPDKINVCKVLRYGKTWPANWGKARSFHTQSFFLHTKHRGIARWWKALGGDHNYSRQITDILEINWIDMYSCKCQAGKGYGMAERHMQKHTQQELLVPTWVLYNTRVKFPSDCRGREGEIKQIPYRRALELEMRGKITINPTGEVIEAKKKELKKKTGKIMKTVIPVKP